MRNMQSKSGKSIMYTEVLGVNERTNERTENDVGIPNLRLRLSIQRLTDTSTPTTLRKKGKEKKKSHVKYR